jgi:hypothetical protein
MYFLCNDLLLAADWLFMSLLLFYVVTCRKILLLLKFPSRVILRLISYDNIPTLQLIEHLTL